MHRADTLIVYQHNLVLRDREVHTMAMGRRKAKSELTWTTYLTLAKRMEES